MDQDFIEIIQDTLRKERLGEYSQNKMFPSTRIDQKDIVHSTPLKYGAVMLLLYKKQDQFNIVYIKRPEYEGPHSGQVAFPGGKLEEFDETYEQAALRETFEEIGIPSESIRVLGALTPLVIYISNFKVFPYVGYLDFVPVFKPDVNEVAYIIEVPISLICSKDSRTTFTFIRKGKEYTVPAYSFFGEIVWGATAMITSEFEDVLNETGFHNI